MKDHGPDWARVLVVGACYGEPAMSYRIAQALEPYMDLEGVQEEINELKARGARMKRQNIWPPR